MTCSSFARKASYSQALAFQILPIKLRVAKGGERESGKQVHVIP